MYQNMPPYSNEDRQYNFPGWSGGLMFGHPSNGPFYGYPSGYQQGYPPVYQQGYPGGQFPQQPGLPQQPAGPPTSPPPAFQPVKPSVQTFAVDPGAIRGCLYQFTYVWLDNRRSFWFYPVFIGRNSVSGYRWSRSRWVYFGIDLNQIESFQCF